MIFQKTIPGELGYTEIKLIDTFLTARIVKVKYCNRIKNCTDRRELYILKHE